MQKNKEIGRACAGSADSPQRLTASEDWGVPSAASDAVVAAEHPAHSLGGPCAGCAFRAGTQANQTAHTMQLARLCVEGITPFLCHEHPHACRGWVAAVNLRGAPESEDDKRWATVAAYSAELLGDAIDAGVAADRAVGAN